MIVKILKSIFQALNWNDVKRKYRYEETNAKTIHRMCILSCLKRKLNLEANFHRYIVNIFFRYIESIDTLNGVLMTALD